VVEIYYANTQRRGRLHNAKAWHSTPTKPAFQRPVQLATQRCRIQPAWSVGSAYASVCAIRAGPAQILTYLDNVEIEYCPPVVIPTYAHHRRLVRLPRPSIPPVWRHRRRRLSANAPRRHPPPVGRILRLNGNSRRRATGWRKILCQLYYAGATP